MSRTNHEPKRLLYDHTVPPYNTGKVLIGSNYRPPQLPIDLGKDAELLQAALLEIPQPRETRAARFVVRHGAWVVLVLVFVSVAFLAGFGGLS